jgi:hypothetical protein
MSRIPLLALVSTAGLLGLAACSGDNPNQPRVPDAALLQQTPPHLGEVFARGVPVPRYANNGNELAHGNAKPGGGGGGGGTGISYHGGPVLQAGTNVAAIYWSAGTIYNGGPTPGSTGSGSSDGSLVGYFMSHVGGSPYFNINSTYTDGSGRAITNRVTYTQYWANNSYNVPSGTTRVSDAQMIAMLQYAFDNGKLSYDANTLYNIFTAGQVNLGGGFGTRYCAYHTHGTVTINGVARTVLYSAMPDDYAKAASCSNGTAAPNGDPHADALVSVLVHEIEETTTDMMGNAWYDATGYENADKCAWNFGTTYNNGTGVANVNLGGRDFLIQQNWINAGSGGCRLSA